MKVTVVQDAIVFVSAITRDEFDRATKFCPESLTLYQTVEDSKKKEPVCAIMVSNDGSVNKNGIVFDSVTEDGKLCLTVAGATGFGNTVSTEEKKQIIVEEFSSLILNVNKLEAQIAADLAAKADEINCALASVETISL